jgi:hypothetical protein
MIEDKKRPFRDDLEDGIGEEDGKIADQTPAQHDARNQYLEGAGREPKKVPQRRVRIHKRRREL